MSKAQPIKDKPKDDLSALFSDVFHIRLGSGGGSGLVHQPQLLGIKSNPSVNGGG